MEYYIIKKDYDSIIRLEEVKSYLRILHNEDDELIKNLIASAVDTAESFLSKNIFTKEVLLIIDNPEKQINLPIVNGVELLKCVINDNAIENKNKVSISKTTLTIDIPFRKAKITYLAESIYQEERNKKDESKDKNHVPCNIKLGILQHIESIYDKKPISMLSILQTYKPYRKINI